MTEQHQARTLVARLRDALHKLDFALERTREEVTEVASQAERLREGVAALGARRQRADTSVGIEMLVDAATAFREAFRELEAGLLDAQADVDTLEAEIEDEDNGQEA
jgi:predicted RNase H-like nuclease (RuvC/YqgF family)